MEPNLTPVEMLSDAISIVHDLIIGNELSPTKKAALEKVFQLLADSKAACIEM